MMGVMSRRRVWLALGTVAAGAAIFGFISGGWAVWRARSVLRDASERVAAESLVRFAMRPVVPSLPVGLESVGAPAVFRDAQVFRGHLFIAGPTGLVEYDNDYAPVSRYRVGAELPPAPLVALTVGTAGDSGTDELWIATAGEGLLAFDGRGLRQIRPEDARFRKITALLALGTGRILVGTEKSGVLVYDGRALRPFHPSLTGLQVTALAGDDTSLWIGTVDRGLLHWNAGALEVIDDALPDRQVLSLALDGEAVYAGTGMGVAEIRGGKFSRVISTGYLAQTLLAADGKLWLGTLDEGMFEVPLDAHPGRGSRLGRANVCPDCSIRRIVRIEGDVYTLAEDSLWRGAREVVRREDAVLADRNIAALAMDGSGRLWIGYFDRGLQILAGGSQAGEHIEDDHLFCVNRIAHDAARGISAVATANGLVMFDASTARRRVITHDDGLIANQVTDVVLRPDGTAVAATPAGVSFIDATGISSIYGFQGLVNNHAYALASDGARTLVGTLGGLSILEGPVVRASFTTANSALRHNWVTSIVRVNDEWFVGTYGGGVLRVNAAGGWLSFDDVRGALEINTNSMAVSASAVYAGTPDRGLGIYNLASGRWNFWTAGLPSRNVTAVEARGGFVYIGTDNGLVKLPESTLVNP
jgi:ligand-binding sensor domain-containing protein